MKDEKIKKDEFDDEYDEIFIEKKPVVSLSRILAENLIEIGSVPLHLWMYLFYSEKGSFNEFKSKFNLSDETFRESLIQLECHNLIEFGKDSQKWIIKDGLDFAI